MGLLKESGPEGIESEIRKQAYEYWLCDMITQGIPPEERARLWQEAHAKDSKNMNASA